MKRLVALVALTLSACGGVTPVNMKDPASVAAKFVEAYNQRDLTGMLPLVDQVNLDAVKEALAQGPGSEPYNSIFNPDMTQMMASQNGRVEGPRYDRRDAIMSVGKSESGDIYAIELSERDDETWMIAAFPTMSITEFENLSDKPLEKR